MSIPVRLGQNFPVEVAGNPVILRLVWMKDPTPIEGPLLLCELDARLNDFMDYSHPSLEEMLAFLASFSPPDEYPKTIIPHGHYVRHHDPEREGVIDEYWEYIDGEWVMQNCLITQPRFKDILILVRVENAEV